MRIQRGCHTQFYTAFIFPTRLSEPVTCRGQRSLVSTQTDTTVSQQLIVTALKTCHIKTLKCSFTTIFMPVKLVLVRTYSLS